MVYDIFRLSLVDNDFQMSYYTEEEHNVGYQTEELLYTLLGLDW